MRLLFQRTDDDATIHDQVIWTIHCTGLEDLILYIASSDEERQFAMHVLEIVSLMFREQVQIETLYVFSLYFYTMQFYLAIYFFFKLALEIRLLELS